MLENIRTTLNLTGLDQVFPTSFVTSNNLTVLSFQANSVCALNDTTCINNRTANFSAVFLPPGFTNLGVINSTLTIATFAQNTTTPTNNTVNCSFPCTSCDQLDGTICTECIRGFLALQGTCISLMCPVLYCSVCEEMACIECLPSFILVNGQCVCQANFAVDVFNSPNSVCTCQSSNASDYTVCQINNCIACSNSSFCIQCVPGFNVTANGLCSGCSVLNCQNCITDVFCFACSSSFNLSTSGTCVQCNDSNCKVCQGNGSCGICMPNYSLSVVFVNGGSVSACVQCNVANCQYCNEMNVCSFCALGYLPNNGTCEFINAAQCELPCASCNLTTGACMACMSPPYSFQPNSNGSCFLCQVLNCAGCLETDPTVCNFCGFGYILDLTNPLQCVPAPSCISFGINGTCLECTAIHALDLTTSQCIPCQVPQGCLNCSIANITMCTGCNKGLFLQNGSCMPCPPLCASCNSNGCLMFKPEVKKVDDIILLVSCRFPCMTCNGTDPFYCTVCEPGFANVNGTCEPCTPSSNCETCNASAPSQCTSCVSNGFLNTATNTCSYCSENCIACQGEGNCTYCVTGFSPVNGICTKVGSCSRYCYICNSDGTCGMCYPGYVDVGLGNCSPGIPGCVVHYPILPILCESCVAGTVLNPITHYC